MRNGGGAKARRGLLVDGRLRGVTGYAACAGARAAARKARAEGAEGDAMVLAGLGDIRRDS